MAVAVLWSQGGEVEQESLFLAVAYLVLGVPAAYSSWHRTLSLAFQEKKRLTFKWFLVFYLFHLAFCLFASISPIEGRSLTGVLSAMAVSSDHGFARVLYFVGFVLFSYEYALSFWVMLSVYMYYRHGGVSLGDDLTSMEP
ncbi:secretory carrier membrane protein, putative [Ricinus communis]|uniref:Secretory carrier-associated membrane protein n=2 Tax=Ricinus communis TaxID=3988 RepID=B9S5Z7_RICCO|nr:secretory carrier membrane protein, putative [Ricinus communis]